VQVDKPDALTSNGFNFVLVEVAPKVSSTNSLVQAIRSPQRKLTRAFPLERGQNGNKPASIIWPDIREMNCDDYFGEASTGGVCASEVAGGDPFLTLLLRERLKNGAKSIDY
jgi:hypothetical protein